MNRTAWLQDRRMNKFVDVLSRFERRDLSTLDASELLGCSERQFLRCRRRYEDEGLDRLPDKRSAKRVSADVVDWMPEAFRTDHAGWSAKHFHEHLVRRHNFGWGYTWTKTQRHTSRFAWLDGEAPLDLVATMDNATSTVYSAFLVEEEGTATSFRGLYETLSTKGLPLSLYTDRGSHYFHTPKAGEAVDKDRLSQVGRALHDLRIEHIPAYSPEARGRSERMFGTLVRD